MPFAQRIVPDHFLADDWDDAWARGWFRMRQSLFTTHFLEFNRHFHSAVWLRVALRGLADDRSFLDLKKRNRQFRVKFSRHTDSAGAAHEALYSRYRASLGFEPAPNLADLLFGEHHNDLFPTWRVELFDGEELIAGGYFDRGESAAGGITAYYDPEYRRHSLGKYLIYLKMEFCRNAGLDYFYPGYLAPGEPRFDYKKSLGRAGLEYLDLVSGEWRPYPEGADPDPLADMVARLQHVGQQLEGLRFHPALRHFLHLDINLNPQIGGVGLFDFPVFLDCFPQPGASPTLVIVFDPRDGEYHLLACRSVYRFDFPEEEGVFGSDLLLAERFLFSSPDPGELAACLAWFPLPVRG